jgi:carboxyl-terminal processing protease
MGADGGYFRGLRELSPMSTKSKLFVLTCSLALVVVMALGQVGVRASGSGDGPYAQLQVYSEVLSRVEREYVDEPNIPQVTNGALHGLLEALDSSSSYLSPAEYKEFQARNGDKGTEKRGGIGAAVSKRFGYADVVSIIPGGAAEKAGIQNYDIIEAIEGKSTHEMSPVEINSLLAGDPGSTVTVSVVRARKAEPQKIVITRDVFSNPVASSKVVDAGVGYIKVDWFTKGKSTEIANLVRTLQKSGATKLILDLRNSADGDPAEGIATANLFLDHGTITYLQGQKYPKQAFTAEADKAITKLPVVVLVNRGTAGPAEIVAAAILENARGDVLGDKTFGAGSIQKMIPLQDNSALNLTIAKYYSPQGKAIQDSAVTPNILVAGEEEVALPEDDDSATPAAGDQEPKKAPQDEQLKKAIEVVKARPAKA